MRYCPACGESYEQGETCPSDGAVLLRSPLSVSGLLGQVLKGTYRIEAEMASGGMGAVLRATQLPIGRPVAVKVLLPGLASSQDLVQRFFREGRILSQLSHPNVVTLLDVGNTDTGLLFLVMELLEGATLEQLVRTRGQLPVQEIVAIFAEACAGVGAAHAQGLVHRDLKPSNVFLARRGDGADAVKVLDFGIAKVLEDNDDPLTKTGTVIGTPGYIAPELLAGSAKADVRSDIYGLGAILYFMMAGRKPYDGPSSQSVLNRQMSEPPEPLDADALGLPKALVSVALRALAREPEQRYPTCEALLAAVREATGIADRTLLAGQVTRTLYPGAPSGTVEVNGAQLVGSREDTPRTTDVAPQDAAPHRRRFGKGMAAAATAVVVLLVVVVVLFTRGAFFPSGAPALAVADASIKDRVAAPTPPRQEVPGVSGGEILAGMSAAFSGPARELGRAMQTGIEAAFAEVNEAGGVHGRKLRLVALDDGYEPDRAVANMREFLDEREVFAVIGNVGTPTAKATLPLALEKKRVFFGAFTGADLLRKDPPERYVFNYRASYAEETSELVRYFVEVKKIPSTKIAVFAQNDEYGDAGYRGVVRSVAKLGHPRPEKVLRFSHERNDVDVHGAVKELVKHKKDVRAVILVSTYRPAARFIKAVRDKRLKVELANVSFVGSEALAEELREQGPRYAEGVIVSQVVPHFESGATGVRQYRDALKKHAPAEPPGFVSLEGYLVGRLFAEGLRRAGRELTVEGLVDALEEVRGFDLGVGAVIDLGPSRHQASDRVWATLLDEGGEYQVLELAP